jgi:hypothetical protein
MAKEATRSLTERMRELGLNAALVAAAGLAIALLGSSIFRVLLPGSQGQRSPRSVSASAGLTPPAMSGGVAPSAKDPPQRGGPEIRVQVLNGCGVPGAGAGMASVLRRAGGLDVIEIGNADEFDFQSSVVLDRTGDSAPAQRVAKILDGAPVLRQRRSDTQSDVTVIVGYDRGRWLTPLPSGGER